MHDSGLRDNLHSEKLQPIQQSINKIGGKGKTYIVKEKISNEKEEMRKASQNVNSGKNQFELLKLYEN